MMEKKIEKNSHEIVEVNQVRRNVEKHIVRRKLPVSWYNESIYMTIEMTKILSLNVAKLLSVQKRWIKVFGRVIYICVSLNKIATICYLKYYTLAHAIWAENT